MKLLTKRCCIKGHYDLIDADHLQRADLKAIAVEENWWLYTVK